MTARRIEIAVICAVGLHSLCLGAAMFVHPHGTLALAGWAYEGPRFFPAQSGIFLILLGAACFAGLRWHHFVWFIVASKATAVMFLCYEALAQGAPNAVLLAALLDGLMGAAMAAAAVAAGRTSPRQPSGR